MPPYTHYFELVVSRPSDIVRTERGWFLPPLTLASATAAIEQIVADPGRVDLEAWAADDLRSVNGQIEYLLRESVRRRKGTEKGSNDERPAAGDPGR